MQYILGLAILIGIVIYSFKDAHSIWEVVAILVTSHNIAFLAGLLFAKHQQMKKQ